MTVVRIVQLVDGEEIISFESVERSSEACADDPRRGALERREASDRALALRSARVLS
jgi:hypothetical protein